MSAARQPAGRGAARRPGTALERRFLLPAWNETQERRYGRQQEVVAAFHSLHDPGRDIRAVIGLRKNVNDWFVDLRVWIAGQPIATQNGLRVSLADWLAFAEMVNLVSDVLVARGILPATSISSVTRVTRAFRGVREGAVSPARKAGTT